MSEVQLRVEREAEVSKPPFAVPCMSDIAKMRGKNGMRVVSTFSGAGGSCLGFEMSGYEIIWASEFVEAASEVHLLNFPDTPVNTQDIRDVSVGQILEETDLQVGELDVLSGSPPCSSFSMIGVGSKYWGDTKKYSDTEQRTDDLFFEFARVLKGLQPRAFIAENVMGLAMGHAKGYFTDIFHALEGCGYQVKAAGVDASWLGVPQRRKRIFFVGMRSDLKVQPTFPKPLPYRYSMNDACPELYRLHWTGNWDTAAGRKPWDGFLKPAPTVTTVAFGAANETSYYAETSTGNRAVTIDELKRLCGFPDDFQLTRHWRKQWERLARSVPPPCMMHLSREMAGSLGA